MWVGVKFYEFFAGSSSNVPKSYFLSAEDTLAKFPELDASRLDLKGSIVYFDGQMNDARHTMALALTAADAGAVALNYVRVDSLTHAPAAGHVSGATATDVLSGRPLRIRAKTVVNAAGPFADQLRKMDDPAAEPLIVPAAGAHLSLPAHVCPGDMGLLIPKTPDGRLLFFLPWEKGTIAGTTDSASDIVDLPVPQAAEVDFILDVMNRYLKQPLEHKDIRSVWAGLRPLVKDPKVQGTAKLSRNHVVLTSDHGLVSVMGGKYTTHRQMAEDTVAAVLADAEKRGVALSGPEHQARLARSVSFGKPIHGAADADAVFGGDFSAAKQLLEDVYGLDADRGDYLVRNYGTRAVQVALVAAERAHKLKIPMSQAVDDAEVEYAVDWESALRAEDVLVRRTRLGFIHTQGARDAAERVVRVMGDKLGWSAAKRTEEKERALFVLSHMDYESIKAMQMKK
jgi:glycerol-3-phosphate dehydrogenase